MSDRTQPGARDVPPAVRLFLRDARRGLSLPIPGHGNTPERFRALRGEAAKDASVGRLFEAHTDAVTILFEASMPPPPMTALAVWASGPAKSSFVEKDGGRFALNGRRAFCGGASIVDAALVLTDSPEGERLILVDLRQPGVNVDPGVWKAEAFRDAGISTVHFTNVEVGQDAFVGPPGWYGSRPGFWYGAVGVAAMWAGISDSLLARLPSLRRYKDGISDAATGSIEASMWAVSALLDQAGRQIDALPDTERTGRFGPSRDGWCHETHGFQGAKSIALACRHTIRLLLEAAISAFDEEVGPAAVAFDADLARARAELTMSLGQTHRARDLVALVQP